MNVRTVILAALLVAGCVGLIILAMRSQRTLERGLPPKLECATQADAYVAALQFAVGQHGSVIPVLGTGSMAPFIPAASAGQVPEKTIVAFIVTVPGATYDAIKPGDLVICRYIVAGVPLSVCHGAAQKDASGWITSGLHNSRSDSGYRVTPQNFTGLVAKVFTWPPAASP